MSKLANTETPFDPVLLPPPCGKIVGTMSKRDLIVLGTSSQHPTRTRNHGAYLFRWNGEGFLVDPGEGTQRQFIYANVPPTAVTRILISHFHGDHSLGLGSMLMRLNLDQVKQVHVYYPASGKKFFDRLRYGTSYHETIEVIEHPIDSEGIIDTNGGFSIEAYRLQHGIENFGYRIKENDETKFYKEKLHEKGIFGPAVKQLQKEGKIVIGDKTVYLDEVSYLRKGDVASVVLDTRPCDGALKVAQGAKILLAESTYLESEKELAHSHFHMTALQVAKLAAEAKVEQLVLTHYSARYLESAPFQEEARTIFPNAFAADDFSVYPFPKRG